MSHNKLALVCAFCLIVFVLAYFWLGPAVGYGVSQYLLAIQSVQRGLHASLSEAVRSIHTDSYGASLILILLSFTYGVFHAAGPGHGKVVISTYLLSHESRLRRGALLSFAAAMVQGLTAILLVSSAFWFFDLSMRQTRGLVNHFEVASFAAIAIVGFYIICSHALRLWKKYSVLNSVSKTSDDGSEGCDHIHGPNATDLEKEFSIRSVIGIILSIGVRPCSGAVIVLLLSFSLDHVVAGLFAVLAMSLGTSLTMILLAAFSIYFRRTAQRIVKSRQGRKSLASLIPSSLGIFGGALIFILGLSLFASALLAPVHPFR